METKKVLVVDDTLHLRILVKKFLERRGFDVVEAGDGIEALRALQLNPEIGLVLLDMMMPKMNGLEFMGKVAPMKESLALKVCAMTAKEAPEDIKGSLKAGADDYIVKPVDEEILVDKVKILLGHKDVNEFATIKLNHGGAIQLPEGSLTVAITGMSENSLFFLTKLQLPVGGRIHVDSRELQDLLRTTKPLILRVYSSERKGAEFENAATFVGLKDSDYKFLRSVTTKGA